MTDTERTFRRDVGTLLVGSLIAQVLALLILPVLTRLYEPGDFGLLGKYLALAGALGTLSLLRYDLAIALPEKDEEGVHVLGLCLVVLLVFTVFFGFGVWLFRDKISELLNNPAFSDCAWMVSLGIFGWGGFQAMSAWASRRGYFKTLSSCIASQSLGQSLAQVCLRVVGHTGLLLGSLIGQALALLGLLNKVRKEDATLLSIMTLEGVRQAAARYWRFPLVSFWSGLVNVLNLHLPVLLFAGLYGQSFVGFYLLGFRILQMPLQLVGRSIAQVFFPEAARSYRQQNLTQKTEDLFQLLTQIGFPFILLVGVSAPEMFHIVFGSNWKEAGEMAMFLAPWLALVFITSPLSNLPFVVQRQSQEFGLQVFMLAVRVMALFVGGHLGGKNGALIAFAVAGFLARSVYLGWLLHTAGVQISKQWSAVRLYVAEGVSVYCIVLGVRHFTSGLESVLTVAIFAFVYMFFTKLRLVRTPS